MSYSNNPPKGVELEYNKDGSQNTKYVDLLDEDKPVAGQKWVCISFVEPENILKRKEIFYFDKFIEQWDFSKSMEKFVQFLNFISFKYKLNFDKLTEDMKEFVEEEKQKLYMTTLEDEYKTYIDNNEESLTKEFSELYNFQTNTRGIKIRGSFPTQEEAELRCKMLRELDPNHDVYVGPVGIWVPFNPEAYKTGKVEYLESELNQIMSEKQKNDNKAKIGFEKRVQDAKANAIKENIEKATKSGNKLTQTLNKDGDLVNIQNMNTTENVLLESNDEISTADIRRELFEGENIVTDMKNNDHGLSQLTRAKEENEKYDEFRHEKDNANNECNMHKDLENLD